MSESPSDPESFRALMVRVRAGDEQAAAELVRHYEPAIRRAARVRLLDTRLNRVLDSMDICQSVMASFFVRAALGQFDLDTPDQLLRLLATMTRNKLVGHVKGHAAAKRDFRRLAPAQTGHDGEPDDGIAQIPGQYPTPSRDVAARALGRSAAAPDTRRAENSGLSRTGRTMGSDCHRAGLESRGSAQAICSCGRSSRTRIGIGRIPFMSSSREPDRSLPALSQDGASIGSRPTPLPLIQNHRQRWHNGQRLSVEAFLEQFPPTVLDDDELLDLIYNEVVLREEDGESPELAEYLRRFPQFAGELRAQFEIHRALQSGHAFTLELSSASFDVELPIPNTDAGEVAIKYAHSLIASAKPRQLPRRQAPAPDLRHESTWPVLHGYDIQAVLGSGGMGTVYRAYDRERRRPVALKVMNRASAATILRFKREFRTLLGVAHPNLVTLYELIFDGKVWFLTMELLEGVNFLQFVRGAALSTAKSGDPVATTARERDSLATEVSDQSRADDSTIVSQSERPAPADALSAGTLEHSTAPATPTQTDVHIQASAPISERLPEVGSAHVPAPTTHDAKPAQWDRLREATFQLANGIAWLHAAGKLHRDIKPTNVIVTREGRVVLLDFGLVADQGFDGRHHSTEEHILGTAAYMAPEQALGSPVSSAADWYSVGVMLFEALTGRLPFLGNNLSVLVDKQTIDPSAPSDLAVDVPADLSALCTELLRRRPEDRPSAADVMRRLGRADSDQKPYPIPDAHVFNRPSVSPGERLSLVGRRRHQQVLDEAMAEMIGGRTAVLYLHGPSGAGKSALLNSFLEERIKRADAVVLAGRCYERESVLYKALDSLIDSLARHLKNLPDAEVAAILPRDMVSLARVFPVLGQVEAHANAPRRAFETPDPQELRRRAFSALRELLARLSDRNPLILAIDDLQWGDVDSAALIAELLRPPDAPVLLFVGAYRTEDRTTSEFLKAIFDLQASHATGPNDAETGKESMRASKLNIRELPVEPLDPGETRALANTLLGEAVPAPGRAALVDAIAHESAGNPFFVAELVRYAQSNDLAARANWSSPAPSPFRTDSAASSDSSAIALDDVLWARIQRLPEEPRRVLELIAVSGQPLGLEFIAGSVDLVQDERVSVALLISSRLVRSTGGHGRNEIETYHDRIRESVVTRLAPDVKRDHHQRLALALEASALPIPRCWVSISLMEANRSERPTTSPGPPIRPQRLSPSTGPPACIAAHGTSSRPRPRRRPSSSSIPGWVTHSPTRAVVPRQPPRISRRCAMLRLPRRSNFSARPPCSS